MKLENSFDNFLLKSVEGFVNLLALPIIKYPDGQKMERKKIVAQGLFNGKVNTSFIPDSWDLWILSQGKPRFFLRSRDGLWMELRNPAPEYRETMKVVMVAAYFLSIAKQRSKVSKGDVWRGDVWQYIWKECRGFKVKPDVKDLEQASQLIRSIVLNDFELQHSSILAEFFPALSYKNIQQEVRQNQNPPGLGNVYTTNVPVYQERSRVPEPIEPRVVYEAPSAPVRPLEGGVTPVASSESEAWLLLLNSTRQATQGPAPDAPGYREVNPTPIAPVTPPEAPESSNQTPIAPVTPPEAPGSSDQTPIAPVTPPEAPESSDQTPIAPVTLLESEAISSGGHEDERPERSLSSRSELPPVTDIPREATLAKNSSTVPSRLEPTPNSATPATRPLDLPVEVPEGEHLGVSSSGDKGKGIAVEDRRVADSEVEDGAGEVRTAEASAVRDKGKGIAVEDRAAEGSAGEGDVDPFPDWVDEPDVCTFCDDGVGINDHLLCCDVCMRSFHTSTKSGEESNCQSLGLPQDVADIKDWVCPNCAAAQQQCFACGVLGNSDPTSPLQAVFECDVKKCKRFYHPHCVVKMLHPLIGKKMEASDIQHKKSTFTCPLHRCVKCKKLDERLKPKMGLVKCRRCPRAWHEKCLPKWDHQKRLWVLEGKSVLYCGKHKIEKNLGTPKRDHILFPILSLALDESGREYQQASGSKEPSSGSKEPASRSKEPALDSLDAGQPRVQGFMADAWKSMTHEKVGEKKRAYSPPTSPQNVNNISEASTLERVKKKPRLYIGQLDSEASRSLDAPHHSQTLCCDYCTCTYRCGCELRVK